HGFHLRLSKRFPPRYQLGRAHAILANSCLIPPRRRFGHTLGVSIASPECDKFAATSSRPHDYPLLTVSLSNDECVGRTKSAAADWLWSDHFAAVHRRSHLTAGADTPRDLPPSATAGGADLVWADFAKLSHRDSRLVASAGVLDPIRHDEALR